MTRDEQIDRLEALGSIQRDCLGCQRFYQADRPTDILAPRHRPSTYCESGKRPHCTCDRCF